MWWCICGSRLSKTLDHVWVILQCLWLDLMLIPIILRISVTWRLPSIGISFGYPTHLVITDCSLIVILRLNWCDAIVEDLSSRFYFREKLNVLASISSQIYTLQSFSPICSAIIAVDHYYLWSYWFSRRIIVLLVRTSLMLSGMEITFKFRL